MRGANNMLNYWRHVTGNKVLLASLFAIAAVIVGAAAMLYQNNPAEAATGRANDIVRGGVVSGQDFRTKVNQNASGDLPAIMNHYGINKDVMATKAVEGRAYKDGTLKVNGKVVLTNAWSIGRNKQSFSSEVKIGSKTYHASRNQDIFQSDGLAVLVYMENGVFKYGVIKSCGNPIWGKTTPPPKPPKPPVYDCVDLRKIRLEDEENAENEHAYQFELTYKVENGAALDSVEFDFGNGETQTLEDTRGTTVTSDTVVYDEPGTYDITTVLNFTVNSKPKMVSSENCTESVVVPKPKEIVVCREGEIITIPEDEKLETDLPEDSEECQPKPPEKEQPPEIPSTGPAEVISGIVGASSIAGAGYYLRSSRRNLLDSIFKK